MGLRDKTPRQGIERAAMLAEAPSRPIIWVGTSKDDLSAMPVAVEASFGFRLRQVQRGQMPADTKPLMQFGACVRELRERFSGNAYRAVHVVSLPHAIYVLHAFMKKSTSGIGLPKRDVDVIEARMKRARTLDAENGS